MATAGVWSGRIVILIALLPACAGSEPADDVAKYSPTEPEAEPAATSAIATERPSEPSPNEPLPSPVANAPLESPTISAPEFVFASLVPNQSVSGPYLLALSEQYVYWLRANGLIERSRKAELGIESVGFVPVAPEGELLIDTPNPAALAVLGDHSALVVVENTVHIVPLDGSPVITVPVLNGSGASGFPLTLTGLDASEDAAIVTGPSCDQILQLEGDGTVLPLVEREQTTNLRSTVRGTPERFWCAGPTLSRYEGTPSASVVDVDVVATAFCEMEDAVVGIANKAPSWIFRTNALAGGDVEEIPGTEGATQMACASDEVTYWAKPDSAGNLHLMALAANGTSTEFHQLPNQQSLTWIADEDSLYWLESGNLIRWPRSALPE